MCTHGVEDHVDAFASRQFDGRDEIGVGCYEYDLIDMMLMRHGGNVQSQAHVDAFLDHIKFEILVSGDMALAPPMNSVGP